MTPIPKLEARAAEQVQDLYDGRRLLVLAWSDTETWKRNYYDAVAARQQGPITGFIAGIATGAFLVAAFLTVFG